MGISISKKMLPKNIGVIRAVATSIASNVLMRLSDYVVSKQMLFIIWYFSHPDFG